MKANDEGLICRPDKWWAPIVHFLSRSPAGGAIVFCGVICLLLTVGLVGLTVAAWTEPVFSLTAAILISIGAVAFFGFVWDVFRNSLPDACTSYSEAYIAYRSMPKDKQLEYKHVMVNAWNGLCEDEYSFTTERTLFLQFVEYQPNIYNPNLAREAIEEVKERQRTIITIHQEIEAKIGPIE